MLKKARLICMAALISAIQACVSNSSPQNAIGALPSDIPVMNEEYATAPNDFSFMVFGDRTGGLRPGIYSQAVDLANHMGPEFVVSVGDYIEGYTNDHVALNKEWSEFEAIIDRLEMPFFFTAGNHDYSNETMAQLWSSKLGRDYYSFMHKDVLFIFLNTEDPPIKLSDEILKRSRLFKEAMKKDPVGTQKRVLEAVKNRTEPTKLPGSVAISEDQLDWAIKTLHENSNVRWTFIILHKPAWLYDDPAFALLEEELVSRPYSVIAGHEHYFTAERRNGRHYIDMGTTGGVWLKDGPGRYDHVVWVNMTDSEPRITSLPLSSVSPVD